MSHPSHPSPLHTTDRERHWLLTPDHMDAYTQIDMNVTHTVREREQDTESVLPRVCNSRYKTLCYRNAVHCWVMCMNPLKFSAFPYKRRGLLAGSYCPYTPNTFYLTDESWSEMWCSCQYEVLKHWPTFFRND